MSARIVDLQDYRLTRAQRERERDPTYLHVKDTAERLRRKRLDPATQELWKSPRRQELVQQMLRDYPEWDPNDIDWLQDHIDYFD
jgi:hypothetical protein